MDVRLNWGILGAGYIARAFAHGVERSKSGRVSAVGSRTAAGAADFAAQFQGVRPHASYEALIADAGVDAVYIATPHPQHAAWAVRAAEAGKHVLCEKPAGLNRAEAMVMTEAARRANVLFMEAFMYRCAPQTARIVELVRSGAVGEVRFIQAAFSFLFPFDPKSRFYSNALGGGGILDVGCYPVSLARLVAGAVSGGPFADPVEVKGSAALNPETGTDDTAAATLKFANGIIAQVSTGVAVAQDNSARIYGTKGWIHIPEPWVPAKEGGKTRILVHTQGAAQEIVVETADWLYALEADAFGRAAAAGSLDAPEMSVSDTLGNLATLDSWRQSAGLVYESEKPQNATHTVSRRPLSPRPDPLPRAPLAGLELPVARLIMGCDNQLTMPHAAAMWDDWFERGGNAFDTAWMYSMGLQEGFLGHWMRHRGVRSQVVLTAKGLNNPHCWPSLVSRQLAESLGRLQTDYADIYILHRDNPLVPVGEFMDALNDEVRAGRVRVLGASNWSIERFRKANAYARRKGLKELTILNNNLSLAHMLEPIWQGVTSSSDPESMRWLRRTQTPFFAWSSQARGFFTDRAAPEKRDDPELVRPWYSDENFERRRRAYELAALRKVQPINIALAYVLCQPFPTWALVGPRDLTETVSTVPAVDIKLSPAELAWLNLERERRPKISE